MYRKARARRVTRPRVSGLVRLRERTAMACGGEVV
jgi:hypothetical protein